MSWTVELCYPHRTVARVPSHTEGGQYAVGGTEEASLYITYNYGDHLREALDDPTPDEGDVLGRLLDGKRAGDCIPMLGRAVERLGVETAAVYWVSTPGNVGKALSILLEWARLHPDARFEVS
jgi:hypothetical protein